MSEVFINRLQPLETVEITGHDIEDMWGQSGDEKEKVNVISYKLLTSSIGAKLSTMINKKTTEENFHSKYISQSDLRDSKIKEILE